MPKSLVEVLDGRSESASQDHAIASSGWLSASEMSLPLAEQDIPVETSLFSAALEFLKANRPYLIIALIAIAALMGLKVVVALMGAINEIPLTAPIFELIGMGTVGWFLYRYAFFASKRAELLVILRGWEQDILG